MRIDELFQAGNRQRRISGSQQLPRGMVSLSRNERLAKLSSCSHFVELLHDFYIKESMGISYITALRVGESLPGLFTMRGRQN
jgi:hypothetical protein